MKNQDDILRSVQKILRNFGILFKSNVMEKKNIHQESIYPISRKKILTCLKERVYFLSTQTLSDKIREKENVSSGELFITTIQPIFRFSFLYLKNSSVSDITTVCLCKPASQIRKQAKYS
jgi:hypothetical protein